MRQAQHVRLKAVLFQNSLAVANLHVQQRVTECNKLQVLRLHHVGRNWDGLAPASLAVPTRGVIFSHVIFKSAASAALRLGVVWPTMSEKPEADYTADVDTLLPQLQNAAKVCMVLLCS